MNKLTITIPVLALLIALSFRANAQQQLSLEQCRKMAIEKNEDLKIAGIQAEQARRQLSLARTYRLPSLSASGTGLYMSKNFEMEMILPTMVPNLTTGQLEPNLLIHPISGNPVIGPDGNPIFNMYAWMPLEIKLSGTYMASVGLEQPIYTGGKISAGSKMAKIGTEMASENISLKRGTIIAEADNAYWTFISVGSKVKLADQAVKMLEEVVQLARNSTEVGMASRNDLLKAQVEYNNAVLNLQKARNGYELSRMNLCRIAGLPPATQIIATDTVIEVNRPDAGSGQAFSPAARPEYRLLEKSISMEDQNIRMARSEYLPTAGVQASYSHIGGIEITGTDFDNTGFNVIASLKIPLFHWGQGMQKIKVARLEKEMKELELTKYRKLMQLEAEQARLNLELAGERIQLSKEALEQAAENLRISRDNYEVGMGTITDLLIAQTQWQHAFTEVIDAKTDFRIKETDWLKATGRLFEE